MLSGQARRRRRFLENPLLWAAICKIKHQTSNAEQAPHLIRHPTQRRAGLLVISSEVEKSLTVPLPRCQHPTFNIQHPTSNIQDPMLRILSGIQPSGVLRIANYFGDDAVRVNGGCIRLIQLQLGCLDHDFYAYFVFSHSALAVFSHLSSAPDQHCLGPKSAGHDTSASLSDD